MAPSFAPPDTPQPALAEFERAFAQERSQLVWMSAPADMDTPVSAYLKISGDAPHSFLLESVEGGEKIGRYSAIGIAPDLIWSCEDGRAVITEITENGKTRKNAGPDPITSLRATLADSRIDTLPEEIPPMAASGLFGYFGYDMVRFLEDLPDSNPDSLDIPQSVLIRPTVMAIFDNISRCLFLATPVRQHAGNCTPQDSAASLYEAACARLNTTLQKINAPAPQDNATLTVETTATATATATRTAAAAQTCPASPPEPTANMSPESFKEMVAKAIEYIRAGEIFQVVPSQRFSMAFDLPPFSLYRSLRRVNPSPFLFYFHFENFALVGSSPEILVRVRDGTVTIRPIAGTRKRGKNAAEDEALATELLKDEKERAEHLMLLDLGRNDVGRVCETGSVKVTEEFVIERYSHVMHIVSNVEGRLREGMNSLDALFAGFPAGTVSGAPKIRAMEIIDELEPVRRSFYAGAVGYLDGHGDLDTCIALRTGVVKGGRLYVQAGGGVVADSDPEFEYQESCNKARALIDAAGKALEQAPGRKQADQTDLPQPDRQER